MEETRREDPNRYESEGYVDWRGRPCNPRKHGGMRAASFVLGMSSIYSSLVFQFYFCLWIKFSFFFHQKFI